MKYIGKINKNIIEPYCKRIITEDVVLTDERKLHIYKRHTKDYKTIINNIKRTISKPDYIIKDLKNEDTVFYIKKLQQNNLNVIIKLATANNLKHPKNSVMSAWIIRDNNLKKLKERNRIIYKHE